MWWLKLALFTFAIVGWRTVSHAADFKVRAPQSWKSEASPNGLIFFNTKSARNQIVIVRSFPFSGTDFSSYFLNHTREVSDLRARALEHFGVTNYSILAFHQAPISPGSTTKMGVLQASFRDLHGDEYQTLERRYLAAGKLFVVTYFEKAPALNDLEHTEMLMNYFSPILGRESASSLFLNSWIETAEASEGTRSSAAGSSGNSPATHGPPIDPYECQAYSPICADVPQDDRCTGESRIHDALEALQSVPIFPMPVAIPTSRSQALFEVKQTLGCGQGIGSFLWDSTIGFLQFVDNQTSKYVDQQVDGMKLAGCEITGNEACKAEMINALTALYVTQSKQSFLATVYNQVSRSYKQFGMCLNTQAQARVMCKLLADVASLAAGGAGVASKLGWVGKLARAEKLTAADQAAMMGEVKQAALGGDDTARAAQLAQVAPEEIASAADPQLQVWQMTAAGQTDAAARMTTQIESTLANGRIVESSPIGIGRGGAKLVKLDDGTLAVWKPDAGFFAGADEEIAASVVDEKLGSNLVPIVVKRPVGGLQGTMQAFVGTTDGAEMAPNPKSLELFDSLIGNNDRHADNVLTSSGQQIAIDHGFAFRGGAENRFSDLVNQQLGSIGSRSSQITALKLQLNVVPKALFPQKYATLQSQLAAAQRDLNLATTKAQGGLTELLGNRQTYLALKNTSNSDWRRILGRNLKDDQITEFLQRRSEILQSIERARSAFGDCVFSEGAVCPLIRAP